MESPQQTEAPERCENCGAALGGRFCSECGQRRTRRITFRRVLAEAVEHLWSFDSTILRTATGLARSPGRLCREYVDGRRKAYMNPLKYAFLAATVFALVINLFDILPGGLPADNPRAVKLFRTIVSALGYLAYLYMLPVAAVQRALFRGQRFGVAECYVTLLFFYGQFLLAGSALSLLGLYSTPYGQWIMRVLGLLLFLWTLAGFYRSSRVTTFLKSALLYLVFTLVNIGSGILMAVAMGVRP